MKNINYAKDEIIEIAKIQKRFCWLYFGLLFGYLFPPVGIIFGIACIFHAYYLARALKLNAGLYVLGVFIPLVNLIVILKLIQKSSKVLRENGIKIGFMGYKKEDLYAFQNKSFE